jgi:hypothetical protein
VTSPQDVTDEIRQITSVLVETGLADDQNLPYWRRIGGGKYIVSYGNFGAYGDILKDYPYAETYQGLLGARDFNIRMLDGALLQMNYEFQGRDLLRHRLAFFPSPDLLEFQNEPDLYMEEVIYADVVERKVVTVPLRFDFDGRENVFEELTHPKSHLTLGQYSRCRIPVSAALMPLIFVDFILRSFYNTAFTEVTASLPRSRMSFDDCTCAAERSVVHIGIPSRV